MLIVQKWIDDDDGDDDDDDDDDEKNHSQYDATEQHWRNFDRIVTG